MHGDTAIISGSYIINMVLGGALIYVWSQFKATNERSHKNELEIVALKTWKQSTQNDLTEIKQDVKRILERLPKP